MLPTSLMLPLLLAFAAFDVYAHVAQPANPDQSVVIHTTTEASLRSGMGLDGYALTYKDADGTALDFAGFSAALAAGRSFSVHRDSNSKHAAFELDAENAPSEPSSAPHGIQPGTPLPPYQGRDLADEVFDSAALRGHASLLNFYFADCAPCVAEVPMLNAIAEANPTLHVHAVTFDDRTLAKDFVQRHAFAWPVLPEAHAFIDALGVAVYPTLLLVDTDGVVRGVSTGADLTDTAKLQAWIDQLLSED